MSEHQLTPEILDTAARAIAGLEEGETWASLNLGGTIASTRNDEYRDALHDQTREVLEAVGYTTPHQAIIVEGEIKVCNTCINSEGNNILWEFAHPEQPGIQHLWQSFTGVTQTWCGAIVELQAPATEQERMAKPICAKCHQKALHHYADVTKQLTQSFNSFMDYFNIYMTKQIAQL